MKKILLITSFLALYIFSFAQKKQLSIEDTGNPAFRPKPIPQLTWRADADQYSFVENNSLVVVDAEKGTKETIITLAQFNDAIKQLGEAENKALPFFTWKNQNILSFSINSKSMTYDVKNQKMTLTDGWNENAENLDIASNDNIAYTLKGNLFVQKAGTKTVSWQSKEDGYQVVVGESVHRQEFGISKGTFWSPKGNKLAFYRMDQSMVTNYPLADYRRRTAVNRNIKYPMAGEKSHHVTVGVLDVNSKKQKVIYLQTGEPAEQYLTNICWSPDEKYIFVQVVNRDQNESKLNCYDAITGTLVRTIFEEKHEKYVEPQHDLTFLPNDSYNFIYQSQRDGFNHLYLTNIKGDVMLQLTSGDWLVNSILGFDTEGKHIYITSSEVTPLDVHAFRVSLETGARTRLTPSEGVHNVQISKSGKYILDVYSHANLPYKAILSDYTAKEIRVLQETEYLFKDYEVGEKSFLTMLTADKTTQLFARMIKPTNFDPNKKYPVLHYVYNGPHVQLVQNRWMGGADMFMEFMASQGYVVFAIDGRGSANRGFAFESAIHRQCGTVEMADQKTGVKFLKTLPFVDTTRMACFGWSYGGFMTTSMMLKEPDMFKIGVAGGPVIDWKYYEVMYTERYMDTPQQNPDGYKNADLTNYVTNLKGKLLVIQGLEDDTVVPQHCYSFVNECIAKGVVIDFFPYPNHPHNVRGKDRVHLYKKIYDYIQRNL